MDLDVLTVEKAIAFPRYAAYEDKPLEKTTSETAHEKAPYEAMKRLFDFVGALLMLIFLSPVMILCAALVFVTSPGPVIYRQRRLTAGGREFWMLKFRSMRQDAESGTGAVWAVNGDPRTTPIGGFLRKYHLDELPQLFNVLSGSMSLVGPRPERPEFSTTLANQYPSFRVRLTVPAGLTGLAQVDQGYCSSVESYRRKIALDRLYVQRRSLSLDLTIAAKTVLLIIHGG